MPSRTRKTLYRYSLLTLLGVTEAVSRADYHVPSKWYTFIDTFRATSSVVHDLLSTVDEEVEKEYRQKEEMLEKRLGKKKFYDENELEQLKQIYPQMEV
ncbi:hypothetical protein [Candidatus Nanohalococcus occultus]|uniref:Uncharacterized protein n=1 Tax=Candidatus Nanohalococcus occultus TaxID=2978047 RepID=A0ABY8CDY3_9ARCH|nr:hypothetical protein SVXNc_0400 [Candidatus Nanohaloarchaeota archaeon SVXNc]